MRIHDSETAYNLKKKPIKESLIALLWNKIRPSLKYVPALSIFLIAIFFLTSKTDSFNTKIGEEKVCTLADGSKIYLNSVSNLNVDKDYNIISLMCTREKKPC